MTVQTRSYLQTSGFSGSWINTVNTDAYLGASIAYSPPLFPHDL